MTPSHLKKAMLADLARSGLTEDDATTMKLSTAPHTLTPAKAGYTIPYFDVDGKRTKFYRVRYLEDTRTGFAALAGVKPLRYNQPPRTVNEVYLPPFLDWRAYFRDSKPLVITEGEKKAATATKHGIPCVGLGGVWCFMSTRAEQSLLPIFQEFNLANRQVYICFDSDAATNPDIVKAQSVLAKRLTEQGAQVYITQIPQAKDGSKQGIDDYIVAHDAKTFHKRVLINSYQFGENKVLHGMNEELLYVRKVGIIYDRENDMKLSPKTFKEHSHSNRWIESVQTVGDTTKLVRKSAAKAWLEWEHRAEVSDIAYIPGAPQITEDGKLNMWSGWGVKDAVKGDVTPWRKLLDHLFKGAEPEARVYFERWCAYPIQNPGAKMAVAAVLWGAHQGSGKTLLGHTLMRLYGRNATEVKDADLRDARFAWAEEKQFVLADDITGHDNRKLSNVFKTMITQKTIHVDQKFVPKYTIADLINYYFTSNDPDAFFLDDGDRRFFIHEVTVGGLPDVQRVEYIKWAESEEGKSALFYYLLNLPMGDFDPQRPAMVTAAKQDMMHISKSELGMWVSRLKDSPDSVLGNKLRGDLFTAEELFILYDPLEVKRASPNALARELKRSGFQRVVRPGGAGVRIGDRQLRLYIIRNKERWEKATMRDVAAHYASAREMVSKL